MKCLLFGNLDDSQYHPLGPVAAELKDLSREIEFIVSSDPADLADPAREGFAAVLNYADWLGRPFPDAGVEGLMNFVASGRGLVTVHNGIIVNNRRYNEWMGAVFTGHPEYQDLSFIVEKRGHPLTENLRNYVHPDEMYRFDFSKPERLDVIVSCELNGVKIPSVWTMDSGAGRTVYLAAGHTAATFTNPVFREILRRSLLWSVQNR